MKIISLIALLFFTSITFSQIDYGKQVKKKDVDKGLVTFENGTDEKGNVFYRFKMDGNVVGGSLLINTAGISTYANYNTNHEMDGTTIEMNNLRVKFPCILTVKTCLMVQPFKLLMVMWVGLNNTKKIE
jgi:hypothetical protein